MRTYIYILPLIGMVSAGVATGQNAAPEKEAGETSEFKEQQLIVPQGPFTPGVGKPIWEKVPEANKSGSDEAIQTGKQLYLAMNCVGCHSHGGGGMGPPLMDQTWIYGSSIEHIMLSIREGRPNGMPSFRGLLPDEQIWQLAAYVKSLSADIE